MRFARYLCRPFFYRVHSMNGWGNRGRMYGIAGNDGNIHVGWDTGSGGKKSGGKGEDEVERGTFSLSFTLDPDLTAVQFDQILAEGEAQAGPLVFPIH